MKDPQGQYYSENMLIYVLAHEYAHCLAKSIGHTDEFHEILPFRANRSGQTGSIAATSKSLYAIHSPSSF